MRQIFNLIIITLVLRFGIYFAFPDLIEKPEFKDGRSYITLSKDLHGMEPHVVDGIDYNKWYFKSPAYILFLKLINQSIYLNILFASLAVFFLYKLNHTAGWILALYPPHWYYSAIFFKESLMITCVVMVIYMLRNKHFLYTLVGICIVMVPFQSIGIANDTLGKSNYLQNFWETWKPYFVVPTMHLKVWFYILIFPYLITIFYWVRHVKLWSLSFMFFLITSFVYSGTYGSSRYRETFMILLFLWIGEQLKREV